MIAEIACRKTEIFLHCTYLPFQTYVLILNATQLIVVQRVPSCTNMAMNLSPVLGNLIVLAPATFTLVQLAA